MKKTIAAFFVLCGWLLFVPFCEEVSAVDRCSVEVHLQQQGGERVEVVQGIAGDIPFLLLRDITALTGQFIRWFGDSGAIGWQVGNRACFISPRSEWVYVVEGVPVWGDAVIPKQEIKSFAPPEQEKLPVAADTAEPEEWESEQISLEQSVSEEPLKNQTDHQSVDEMPKEAGAELTNRVPVILRWEYTVTKEKLPTPPVVRNDQMYIHSSLLSYLGYAGVWQEPSEQYLLAPVEEHGSVPDLPLSIEEAYGKIKTMLTKDTAIKETVLGRYKTIFHPGEKSRTVNLKLAAAAINGQVILPGKTFSFNKTVGPRTRERGYLEATIFVSGKKEQGMGGGICQVSSTLYNAVLNSKLRVVERHTHSLPVTYVPTGRDATVSYGYLDFRFQNNGKRPVKIRAIVERNILDISFLVMP